jgi:hypothetical protein
VDDADFDYVRGYRWHVINRRHGLYVAACETIPGTHRQATIYLHRLVLDAEVGELITHADGNGLNNCRSNLRRRSRAQIQQGRKPHRGRRYRGVSYGPGNSKLKPWIARIKTADRVIHYGSYATPEEAAMAYNEAARILFGDFARLNPVATESS